MEKGKGERKRKGDLRMEMRNEKSREGKRGEKGGAFGRGWKGGE